MSRPEAERPTAIFCSPTYRCIQTASPSSIALGVPLFVEAGLTEFHQPVIPGTGLHPRACDAKVLQKFFPKIDPSWSHIWLPSRRGEDVAQHHERITGFISALLPCATKGPRGRIPSGEKDGEHKCILLVTHAVPVIGIARVLLKDMMLSPQVGCASITELVWRNDSGGEDGDWELAALAGTAHLSNGMAGQWGWDKFHGTEQLQGVPGTENEGDSPVGFQISQF